MNHKFHFIMLNFSLHLTSPSCSIIFMLIKLRKIYKFFKNCSPRQYKKDIIFPGCWFSLFSSSYSFVKPKIIRSFYNIFVGNNFVLLLFSLLLFFLVKWLVRLDFKGGSQLVSSRIVFLEPISSKDLYSFWGCLTALLFIFCYYTRVSLEKVIGWIRTTTSCIIFRLKIV